MDEISFDKLSRVLETDLHQAEYQALRATIRERGTARVCALLAGFIAWGALATVVLVSRSPARLTLVPLLVLVVTYEINFFIHTAVERVGRYIQVRFEEMGGIAGWETSAMNFGSKFPSGIDPLFGMLFFACATVNLLTPLATTARGSVIWIVIAVASHLAFGYRIVTTRKRAAAQRGLDLERFRHLLSK